MKIFWSGCRRIDVVIPRFPYIRIAGSTTVQGSLLSYRNRIWIDLFDNFGQQGLLLSFNAFNYASFWFESGKWSIHILQAYHVSEWFLDKRSDEILVKDGFRVRGKHEEYLRGCRLVGASATRSVNSALELKGHIAWILLRVRWFETSVKLCPVVNASKLSYC